MKNEGLYRNNYNRASRKTVIMLIWCIIISIFLFFPGCNLINDQPLTTNDDTAVIEESPASDEGSEAADSSTEAIEENGDEEAAESVELTINVYYSDSMGEYLAGEARIISSENKYVDAFNELMKPPIDSNLVTLVPDTTIINSIIVENGTANVDLSNDFVDDRFVSDTVDIMLVYTIVNTLTEFDEVNSVLFYIDGEKLDILGQLDILDPVFRRSDLIK